MFKTTSSQPSHSGDSDLVAAELLHQVEQEAAAEARAEPSHEVTELRELTLDQIRNFEAAAMFFSEVPRGLTARQIRVLGRSYVLRCGDLYLTTFVD